MYYMGATPIHPRCLVNSAYGSSFEFRIWSGARDLNPGPHGPEPCRQCVLDCPAGSAGGLLNSNTTFLVSRRDLLEPSGGGNP